MKNFFYNCKGTFISTLLIFIAIIIWLLVLVLFGKTYALFSTLAMLLTVISLLFCYCHFRNQEEANETLDKIARHLSNIEKNTKTED